MDANQKLGFLFLVIGAVAFIRHTIERGGAPLTGKVVGNKRIFGRWRWEYRPRIQYKHPKTGELNQITPWDSRNSEWEIGSEIDLVFHESNGKVRTAHKSGFAFPLILIAGGALLSVYAWT